MSTARINSDRKRYKRKKVNRQVIIELLTRQSGKPKRLRFLNFKEKFALKSVRFKKRAKLLVKRMAAEGDFDGVFTEKEIKRALASGKLPRGYIVDYQIPTDMGGLHSLTNMYVVDRDVAFLMDALYWHQVRLEVNAFLANPKNEFGKIGVFMEPCPRFFSLKNFLEYILPDEKRMLGGLLRRRKEQAATEPKNVIRQDLRNGIILRLSKRPPMPENMEMTLVPVELVTPDERGRVRAEYTEKRPQIIQESIIRGDFKRFSAEIQEYISRTGRVPTTLSCHHILPRALGGKNDMKNVCWLTDEEHQNLHKCFITPLANYFSWMMETPRPVFMELPVPTGSKIKTFFKNEQGLLQLKDPPKAERAKMRPLARKKGKYKD